MLPPSVLLEAAVESLVVLSSGPRELRRHLAADRLLAPRLVRLMQGGSPPHVARRAAQILSHLAQAAEAHGCLRAYEWELLHLGMHEALGATTYVGEALEELCER